MTRVRQLIVGGALMVGLVALFSIGIGVNIHSSPAVHAQHPVAFGNGAFVTMNPKTGKVVALGSGVTVTMNPKTGEVVALGSGVTVTMNPKTGQIVSVNSGPRAER